MNRKLSGFHEGNRRSQSRIPPSQKSANDPLYDEQYYLHNTSSNLGTFDTDIDAPGAWYATKGSSSITVAVLDDGVEQHEDFRSGQVVTGYTATVGGGDGSPRPGSTHGQAVAGIVAANHNSLGVRGVAPNVNIMPINIFNPYAFDDQVADAIDYAWQNGADVLNNSWGQGRYIETIAAAFTRARFSGRNGKGAVIVASAGNNGEDVTFPATMPGVLTVGAVDRNGNKESYSPTGQKIDIVAPSGDTEQNGDVRTMDRMGASGYGSGNYTSSFGGTSAAAPQAAGVAALVISEHGGMTEAEVRDKIKDYADNYGLTNWDGSGRLNAAAAVLPQPLSISMSGPTEVQSNASVSYEAHVSKGNPPYTIRWYDEPEHPIDESPEYNPGDPAIYTKTTGGSDDDFYIQAEVEDESGSVKESPVYLVNVVSSGGDPGNCPPGETCECPPGEICVASPQGALATGELPPEAFALEKSHPNPVRAGQEVTIPFALPEAAEVTLALYDMLGREVRRIESGTVAAGRPQAVVGTGDLASGVYVYRLRAIGAGSGEPFTGTGKLVVVK